jgi:hypothetical protein
MSPYLDDLQAAGGRSSHTAEILVLYYSRTGATAELALPVCRGVLFGNLCILHVWNEKPGLARNFEGSGRIGYDHSRLYSRRLTPCHEPER